MYRSLLAVAKSINARRVLEIGTYDGFTALNLVANLPEGGEVATVDLPEGADQTELRAQGISNAATGDIIGSMYRNEPERAKIKEVRADSSQLEWKELAPKIDLIFVDGCHDYQYVLKDSMNAIASVKSGGVIFWHDYGQAVDVTQVLDELAKKHPVRAIKGTRLAVMTAA